MSETKVKNPLPPTRLGSGPEGHQFWLRNLRVAGGDETIRYEATLMQGMEEVALVSNGGTGGQCHLFPKGPARIDHITKLLTKAAEETLPPLTSPGVGTVGTVPMDWCTALCILVANTECVSEIHKNAGRETMFIPEGDDPAAGFLRITGTDAATRKWVKDKYPGHIILNDFLE